jgi:hypothetical protein
MVPKKAADEKEILIGCSPIFRHPTYFSSS